MSALEWLLLVVAVYGVGCLVVTAVELHRAHLAGLAEADPHTYPARFDTGQSFAVGAGSRLAQPSRSDAIGGLEAVPDAQDAWPGAEGAEPQPAHPAGTNHTPE